MTCKIARTEEEIDHQLNRADEAIKNGTNLPDYSYEEGVRDAILYLLKQFNDPPLASAISTDAPAMKLAPETPTYGFARRVYDNSGNCRFNHLEEKIARYNGQPGRWPYNIHFVPEVVKLLLHKPTSLKDLVERAHELNRIQSFESNVLDIPQQLLEGLEVGAVAMSPLQCCCSCGSTNLGKLQHGKISEIGNDDPQYASAKFRNCLSCGEAGGWKQWPEKEPPISKP